MPMLMMPDAPAARYRTLKRTNTRRVAHGM